MTELCGDIRKCLIEVFVREQVTLVERENQGFAAMRYNRCAVARYSASPLTAGRE